MPLESATTINQLVSTNPAGTDDTSRGDDHIRLLKSVLLATFPGIEGAVTATHVQLNQIGTIISTLADAILKDGSRAMTGALSMGTQRIVNLGAPTAATDAATRKYVDDAVTAALATAEAHRRLLYPVGSRIILGGNNGNPATLLGFGTWSLVSKDRVMVGAGTTYTLGETGGSETVNLTEQQLPAHKHLLFSDSVRGAAAPNLSSPTLQVPRRMDKDGDAEQYSLKETTEPANVGLSAATGQGNPVSVLQPFEAVNIWQRTA